MDQFRASTLIAPAAEGRLAQQVDVGITGRIGVVVVVAVSHAKVEDKEKEEKEADGRS
jgi:hypothetical protein